MEDIHIEVLEKKADERPSRVEKLEVEIKLPAQLDEAYKEKLIQSAKRVCTIGNTLEAGAQIELKVIDS